MRQKCFQMKVKFSVSHTKKWQWQVTLIGKWINYDCGFICNSWDYNKWISFILAEHSRVIWVSFFKRQSHSCQASVWLRGRLDDTLAPLADRILVALLPVLTFQTKCKEMSQRQKHQQPEGPATDNHHATSELMEKLNFQIILSSLTFKSDMFFFLFSLFHREFLKNHRSYCFFKECHCWKTADRLKCILTHLRH